MLFFYLCKSYDLQDFLLLDAFLMPDLDLTAFRVYAFFLRRFYQIIQLPSYLDLSNKQNCLRMFLLVHCMFSALLWLRRSYISYVCGWYIKVSLLISSNKYIYCIR